MLSFFYFTLHNDYEKAKDFMHDLFIKIIENHHKFNTSQIFKTWIYTLASNMCNNEFRRNKVIESYKIHIKINSEIIDDNDDNKILLQQSINKLSIDQRALIVLRFKLKLSIKEIAEIYECAEGTIKSRLFYATKELSRIYKI